MSPTTLAHELGPTEAGEQAGLLNGQLKRYKRARRVIFYTMVGALALLTIASVTPLVFGRSSAAPP
ncbi:hypothetical protein THASP1DRAFT_33369, partial [Thamnocephalis sphaerospora]